MIELLARPETWIALLTLTALELVLGIDNIVFISILVDKVPAHQRALARRVGILLALVMRVALLFLISWIVGLTAPIFAVLGNEISGRDLILILGGLFLFYKSTKEIHQLLEGEKGERSAVVRATFASVIVQITLIDMVFSLDSIITAVGMVSEIAIMIAAVVVSLGVMLVAARSIGEFVTHHPTVKMLALSFLFVIGVVLIADGFDHHVPKGYVYFAMAFSVGVEMLNLRLRKCAARPVELHEPYAREGEEGAL